MTRAERAQVRHLLRNAAKDLEAARKTLALASAGDPTVAWIGADALYALRTCENTINSVRERIAP